MEFSNKSRKVIAGSVEDLLLKIQEHSSEGEFRETFYLLGKTIIPHLQQGSYSSIIIDARSGLLPGQVFRAWNALAAQKSGQQRISVLALRASRKLADEELKNTFDAFAARIGNRPLVVTDFIASGETVERIINLLNMKRKRKHITVAPVAALQEGINRISKKYGRKVTVLPGSPHYRIEKMFDSPRLEAFQLPPPNWNLPHIHKATLRWSNVNRWMRDMGRGIWQEIAAEQATAARESSNTNSNPLHRRKPYFLFNFRRKPYAAQRVSK